MSNLKYKTVEELQIEKTECERRIGSARQVISGQLERLKWVEQYLHEKTPVELTMREIEARLGHRVILK